MGHGIKEIAPVILTERITQDATPSGDRRRGRTVVVAAGAPVFQLAAWTDRVLRLARLGITRDRFCDFVFCLTFVYPFLSPCLTFCLT